MGAGSCNRQKENGRSSIPLIPRPSVPGRGTVLRVLYLTKTRHKASVSFVWLRGLTVADFAAKMQDNAGYLLTV